MIWGWVRERKLQPLLCMSGLLLSLVSLLLLFSPLTSAEHWVFSLTVKHSQNWGMGNASGCSALVKAVSPSAHGCTQHDLDPAGLNSCVPGWIVNIEGDQIWFQALVPTAAMMFRSCILSFCFFMGKSVPTVAYIGEVSNTVCHLISVMTEVTALHLTQLSNSVNCTAGRTQNSQRSPENFPTKPHVSEENPFILF